MAANSRHEEPPQGVPSRRPANSAPPTHQPHTGQQPSATSHRPKSGPQPYKSEALNPSFEPEVDYSPLQVYSERQLMNEMDAINTALSQKDEWEARVAGMQRILRLIYGGAMSYDGFLPALKRMSTCIRNQLLDLRSCVIKSVTAVVSLMAQALGESFDVLAVAVIDSLLKTILKKIEVRSVFLSRDLDCSVTDLCVCHRLFRQQLTDAFVQSSAPHQQDSHRSSPRF